MKVGTAAPRGSFGIPPELQPENVAKRQEAAQPPPPVPPASASAEQPDDDELPISEKAKNAAYHLKTQLDVEMSGDDWSSLYYKGFVEKKFVICKVPDPATKTFKDLSITVRTLTAAETDEADELFAAEVENLTISREGLENRRAMWNLTYAIQEINGMALCKPVRTENGIDRKATAKEKRKILLDMPAVVLKQASIKHGQFVKLIDVLVSEPDQAFFA